MTTFDVSLIAAIVVAAVVLILFCIVLFLYIGEKRQSRLTREQAKIALEQERIALEQAKVEWRTSQTEVLRAEQAEWRASQIEMVRAEQREKALSDALLQLETWKSQELEAVRVQHVEIARREAQVELEQWKTSHSKEIRQDAIQKSQAVVTGKVTEHFVPYLPDFHFNPKDARFLGTPIDFVVFDGLDQGDVKRVVFVEVKTGASQLSPRERQVRKAIDAHNVEWILVRPQLSQATTIITETTDIQLLESFSADGQENSAPTPESVALLIGHSISSNY